MPLPKLSDAQIGWLVHQVAAYIDRQRQTYRGRAAPLDANQMAALRPFFPASSLNAARLVLLARETINNPPFYGELLRMGFEAGSLPDFTHMTAMTFVETIVFHGPLTDRVLFHELVHVVQYEKLGLADFADKYVRGFLNGGSYEAIPLERNAYQLDTRFAVAPTNPFSVEADVHAWIETGRF